MTRKKMAFKNIDATQTSMDYGELFTRKMSFLSVRVVQMVVRNIKIGCLTIVGPWLDEINRYHSHF